MIRYRLDLSRRHVHRFGVQLIVPNPAGELIVSLPVWIPGSYLVREFARHLSGLQAFQGEPGAQARATPFEQLDKATWKVCPQGTGRLVVNYEVYAFDTSVRAAFLDAQRAFFNGTSVFLRVEGREHEPHTVELVGVPEGWEVATTLPPAGESTTQQARDGSIETTFRAASYDELVDHPVELGRFWRGRFSAAGIGHEFVVAGALPDFDGERLLADSARICEAQIAFWHGTGAQAQRAPFDRYVFMLNAVDEGHGGLEHRSSTALIAPRRDLPRRPNGDEAPEASDGYVQLLGLISHEYFHTWNVKRLRPRDFERYDYTRENYTSLLWFFEGFTSYYDDLFLRRSGLIDDARYLKLLARTVSSVATTPGRQVQSVAQASFDAWVKYYRSDENTPNATISYYAKGSLVALALDLTLRHEGLSSLDELMRRLWQVSAGGPISEDDIAAALEGLAGRSFGGELVRWVHGTEDLPLRELLGAVGVEWQAGAPTMAQRWGVRVSENALTGVKVTHVLHGGPTPTPGESAGLAAGDEVLALQGWRLRRLEDAARVLAPGQSGELLVSRDQRVLRLPITMPLEAPQDASVTLKPSAQAPAPAQALLRAWLTG